MQGIGAVVAIGGGIVVGSAVLFVVEADMNGAAEFGKVAIEIAEKEFDVAAEEFFVFVVEVALEAVGFHVFGAEHADGALKLETGQRKIERDDKENARFPEDELSCENGDGGESERDHDAVVRECRAGLVGLYGRAVDETVVGAGQKLIRVAQGTNFSEQLGHAIKHKGKRAHDGYGRNACQTHQQGKGANHEFEDGSGTEGTPKRL